MSGYLIFRLIASPFHLINRTVKRNGDFIACIPSTLLTLLLVCLFFRTKYDGLFNMAGTAFIFILFGGIACTLLNFVTSILIRIISSLAGVFDKIYSWAAAKEDVEKESRQMKNEAKQREKEEKQYKKMTKERDYTMCRDFSRK